jgi:membrane carboxypeptidase/penicillin-binding protein
MAKRQVVTGKSTVSLALGALDEMEPELRHLTRLITAFQILGEAGDSIDPTAVLRLRDVRARL